MCASSFYTIHTHVGHVTKQGGKPHRLGTLMAATVTENWMPVFQYLGHGIPNSGAKYRNFAFAWDEILECGFQGIPNSV